MTNTSDDRSPAHTNRDEREPLKPTAFPNLEAALAARPNTEQNTFAYDADAAREVGHSIIAQLHGFLTEQADLRLDVSEGIAAENVKRAAMYSCSSLIRGLWGSVAYTHAYSEAFASTAATMATRQLNPEGLRGAVYGYAEKLELQLVRSQAKDAECAVLTDMLHGMTEAFEQLTGEEWKAPAPRDERDAESQKKNATTVAERLQALLAARRAKSA